MKTINNSIKDGYGFVIQTYTLADDTDEKIQKILTAILDKFNKGDIYVPLFSCIKELLANALKANARRILIDDGIITNPDNSREVAEKVRTVINDKALADFGTKARQRGLSAKIHFRIQGKSLAISVINNTPLLINEIDRINDKIDKCREYDDIAKYYMENPDPTAEGMGLGLSMVVILLKTITGTKTDFNLSSDCRYKTAAQINVILE
jgi:hypothetical protein